MTTSLYMPDVKVELALGDGYATAAGSRTWTDVSTYVELAQGISIGFGRGDELSTADANTLSLTLDNTDGRFTAGLTSGAYYPDVKIGTPIRVTATPVGGSASRRFVGFVDEWPVAWDGTDNYAMATITASSRLARVGLDSPLRSIIEETYGLDSPLAHFPFGEAENATQAGDVSGHGVTPLRVKGSGTAVVFGTATGPSTDSLTALTTAGGQYLGSVNGPNFAYGSVSVEGFFATSAASGTLFGVDRISIVMSGAGVVTASYPGIGTLTGPDVNDGLTHHVALTADGTNVKLYIDGTLADTIASSLTDPNATNDLSAGSGTTGGIAADLAHFAIYGTALSAARVADHAAAGLTGFAGEATDDRLARYALLAGIASTELSADAGTTTCAHVDSTDATAVDLMRQVETTEGGVLFDAADGTLTFHNRAHRYTATADLTLDMAAHRVGADFALKLDRTGLVNDATVATADGTVTGRSVNTTSRDYYGPATTSVQTLSTDDEEPQQAAWWIVATRAEPQSRVPTLTVDLLPFDTYPSQNDVLALTIGDRIDVTNQPDQAAVTDASYFVEGYTETIGPESYDLTFNVSPGSPTLDTLLLDSATRGLLNTNTLAY